ncbi:peptide deformylase [Lagierella sp.]|uniref:peptide deformylase n=1 Tax=Lagierella sp. TaxID=2849657 RepID=UPI002602D115|nr:peptide deformylase [Lagierella sp.]
MAIRKIRIEGDPILRKKARRVEKIDERTLEILADMEETMKDANGLGLAAPQVGILRRLVVVDMQDGKGTMKMINPTILDKSEELQENLEGCLSIPGKSGLVDRPKNLVLEYTDENGKLVKLDCDEYKAVCVCHELDHLDGILYPDLAKAMYDNDELEKLEQEDMNE